MTNSHPSKQWAHLKSERGPLKSEKESQAHKIFRSKPGHKHHAATPRAHSPSAEEPVEHQVSGIVSPGSTGVMYCSERAAKNGFSYGAPGWSNFGQGAPETGPIPGGSERPSYIDIAALGGDAVNEYAPTNGQKELRDAIAHLYNVQYREGKPSQYTYENVAIVPGGRAGLTRCASVIGEVLVSYQVPEYTAYDQVMSSFKRLVPIPTTLDKNDAYKLNLDKLRANIKEQGLSVVVASNPRNPTGQVIKDDELKQLVHLGQEGCTLILDEFYSWYEYELEEGRTVSAAEFIDDVNADGVVIINGLTKCWRLPGWRVCWVIGPKKLIEALGQAGGALDGGAAHVLQAAAVPFLEPSRVKQDIVALQRHFKAKRDHILGRLDKMGLKVFNPPTSTFYIWLDLSQLPSPLNSGLAFFEAVLRERVIVVPGIFFDLNPSHRRNLLDSPCNSFVRLSFGPPMEELDQGLDGIERMLNAATKHVEDGADLHDFLDNLKV